MFFELFYYFFLTKFFSRKAEAKNNAVILSGVALSIYLVPNAANFAQKG